MDAVINTEVYNSLGQRWYTADDDPIALLRSQSKTIAPWVIHQINKSFHESTDIKILDVGCGAGFLSNRLALENWNVTGLDVSAESLAVAKNYDPTRSVRYVECNAMNLAFENESFDVVTAMDFLEHVESPELLVKEISRVLKPGGLFLFHTFNRNILSKIIIIKLVEYFVRNTPRHLHLHRMFVKPEELESYCMAAGMVPQEMKGLEPQLRSLRLSNLVNGTIPKNFKFVLTESLKLSYLGFAKKTPEM